VKIYIAVMTIRRTIVIFPILLLVVILAGCLSISFGDVLYSDGALHVPVKNSEGPQQVLIQVRVYDTTDFRQNEIFTQIEYVDLDTGENEYIVPVELDPGTYKVYLYVIYDDDRIIQIRDLEV
jgi:hypothetical protein